VALWTSRFELSPTDCCQTSRFAPSVERANQWNGSVLYKPASTCLRCPTPGLQPLVGSWAAHPLIFPRPRTMPFTSPAIMQILLLLWQFNIPMSRISTPSDRVSAIESIPSAPVERLKSQAQVYLMSSTRKYTLAELHWSRLE